MSKPTIRGLQTYIFVEGGIDLFIDTHKTFFGKFHRQTTSILFHVDTDGEHTPENGFDPTKLKTDFARVYYPATVPIDAAHECTVDRVVEVISLGISDPFD